MINEFLTSIARDHSQNIRYVMVIDLENRHLGEAHKFRDGTFRILIDPRAMHCPYATLFVVFHEVGHILINDFNSRDNSEEVTADRWALQRLGIMNADGLKPKPEWFDCFCCMTFRRDRCPKEVLQRGK